MLRYGSNALSKWAKSIPCSHQFVKIRYFASQSDFEDAQKRLVKLSEEPDSDVKLKVYGLFKQATIGDVSGDRPGMVNFVARAKYDAWGNFKGISQEDARQKYVDLVNELQKSDTKAAESVELGKVRGLKYGREGDFYRIHFDRPEKFNSITIEMYRGLGEAMKEANEDPKVKFTVFSASGPYYCAGNDLTTFAKIKTREDLKRVSEEGAVILEEFVASFIDHNKPIIALIHGPAIGISVTTLALCDVILASDKATFQTPFTSLGYSPEGCSSYTFSKIMGYSKANEILIFGKKFTAQEALDIGFISRVIPHGQFESETAKILAQYAEFPADSLRFNKKTIRDFERQKLHEVNKLECKLLCERWQSKDCAEAMQKFMTRKQ